MLQHTLFAISCSLILLFSSYTTIAQSTQPADNECPCCTAPHTDFDFWVGEWSVTDTAGNHVGDNTIARLEANCLLQESWRGKQGGTGTSINYYNRTDSTWNQTWVDSKGTVLNLKGGLVGNSMQLRGELTQGRTLKYYNQITWTPNPDGTVTQLWEIYSEDGKVLRTLFKGIYRRKTEK